MTTFVNYALINGRMNAGKTFDYREEAEKAAREYTNLCVQNAFEVRVVTQELTHEPCPTAPTLFSEHPSTGLIKQEALVPLSESLPPMAGCVRHCDGRYYAVGIRHTDKALLTVRESGIIYRTLHEDNSGLFAVDWETFSDNFRVCEEEVCERNCVASESETGLTYFVVAVWAKPYEEGFFRGACLA